LHENYDYKTFKPLVNVTEQVVIWS